MHARAQLSAWIEAGLALWLVATSGCGESYPWEHGGPAPTLRPAPAPSASETVAPLASGQSAPLEGGLFASCANGLVAEDDPVIDVTRLFAVCGPPTGMDRGTEAPLEGAISEGRAPATLPLELRAGRCYRVFAVADPHVGELDVELRSSRDTLIASDHQSGRVAVVQPDRPFCALADDTARLLVSARQGSGAFALEIGVE